MKGYILVIIVILTSTIQIFSQGYQNRESLDFYRNYKMKAGEWKIIISVEDTGVGIPEGMANLVYLPISDKGEEATG